MVCRVNGSWKWSEALSKLVSIIIPSIRPQEIEACLSSIDEYTEGFDYEVLVTAAFEIKKHLNTTRIVETEPEGTYRAVAQAYEYALGEYIVHIPDDARATPFWLSNMLDFMRPHDREVFEGSFRYYDKNGEGHQHGYYGKRFAAFICIRRDVADHIGGLMDTSYRSFYGDPDLGLRVWKGGGQVKTCYNAWLQREDCLDDKRVYSRSLYFSHDEKVFVDRWHKIYGNGIPFNGSYPVGHILDPYHNKY